MSKIYIIHENDQWFEPLKRVFTENNLPHESYFLAEGSINLQELPPEGVFFSKMSASSYTRNHQYSPDYAAVVLGWLETHGRRVVNGTSVLRLEISKIDQYVKLQQSGINVPKTAAIFGKRDILAEAKKFSAPFILKPNRGGKGIGVQLFQSHKMLEEFLESGQFEPSIDDVTLIQEYIQAPQPFITRLEFIGGKFVYAVRVDTSEGFELCPAEACRIDAPAAASEFCAIDAGEGLFRIIDGFNDPIIGKLESFLKANKIEVAGIEFISDAKGDVYVYDINTNTNYNPEAEKKAGVSAVKILTEFLREELRKSSPKVSAAC